jgi:phage portal protein BeeE
MTTNIDSLNFARLDHVERWEERMMKGEPFVRWGADNLVPERLYIYTDYSPIHNACIRSKVDNASGRGFTKDYRINKRETLNEVLKQMFFEFIVTGNLFLEITFRKDRQGISGFNIIPSKYIRAKQPENYELYSDDYYFCRDWVNWRKSGIVELKGFDPNAYEDRQLIAIKSYNPGYLFYGTPDWTASELDVRLSRAISQHNLSLIANGGAPSLWVHLPESAPDSQTDQENVLARLENRYTGPESAGRIILSWGGPDGQKPEITQMNSNLQGGMFSEIFALVRENILAGHRIPDPSLLGLPTASGFSSQADQLKTAYRLFQTTTIFPLQSFLIDQLQPVVQLLYPDEKVELIIEQNNILPDEL